MTIIPINFGVTALNKQPVSAGDREAQALDAYSNIVTTVVDTVAPAMVGIQRKAKPGGERSGDPRLQGGAGPDFSSRLMGIS